MLRRAALARAKFLEDHLNAEDHDLILQMGTRPGFVRVVGPVTLAWRRHAVSETRDSASSFSGALRLLRREKLGAYPGGSKRARERHRILARHIRPAALRCLREGELTLGRELYFASFGWNLELGHWRYILAFPIFMMLTVLRRVITRGPRSS